MLSICLRFLLLVPVLFTMNFALAGDCDVSLRADCLQMPITIQPRYSLSSDNWYPLSEAAMKSAVIDTALADLTNNGFFTIKNGQVAEALMDFDLSLIGPAETVKLTIRLSLPDHPTFVATSSLSVRELDHQGIYQAIEQLGENTALHMLDKVEAYLTDEPEQQAVEYSSQNRQALQRLYAMTRHVRGRSYMHHFAAEQLHR